MNPLPRMRIALRKHRNVIITPHIAGVSPLPFVRWLDTFCENLRRFVAGEDDLESRIDQRRGY